MCYIITTMDIEYFKQINFQYRELMVARLGKTNNKQCYLELFKYLHKHGAPHTVKESGVFFTLNDLEQRVVYQQDETITKYE